MRKKGSKGFAKVVAGILAGILLAGTGGSHIAAAEAYTVKECKAIMYTNDKATVYTAPDFESVLVTTITSGLPVDVTGITSNGWFRIDLKGTYYIPGYGLEERTEKIMAQQKKGFIARMLEGKERSEEYARTTLPTNRWQLFFDIFTHSFCPGFCTENTVF